MTAYAVTDSLTMFRRDLRHMVRYPSMTVMLMAQPIVFLLLFVYVFGSTLGNGISSVPGANGSGRSAYVTYVTPAILVMAAASVALGTAVSVALDMQTGIVARFRAMSIARVSVLAGHVLGALVQSVLAVGAALGVAVAIGYRSGADVGQWLGAAGVVAAFTFALTWLTVALGVAAKSVESASNTPLVLVLLPFLGSGFVPADSMPGWLAWFARNQPFTPVMESVRGLLAGDPSAHPIVLALAWSAGIGLLGCVSATRLYERRSVR